MNKRTLVIGASEHSYRYSHMAVHRLLAAGHEVVALGVRKGRIGSIPIEDTPRNWQDIHTVTIYLNPYHQQVYYRYIIELNPKRVIFNPGAENNELALLLVENGIKFLNACTLVMLSAGNY